MDRAAVEQWVAEYERAWRTPGTEPLAELFVPEATYLASPWAQPVEGLDAISAFWEAERDGADEEFTMSSEVVAVDGAAAVVRVFVEYGGPRHVHRHTQWRDLWVLRFAGDGRCTSFEEWPFAPDHEHPIVRQPPAWAVDRARDELQNVDDQEAVEQRAWDLTREAQEREDERHDEYDDPDQGGEA